MIALTTVLLLFSFFGGNYPDEHFGYELPVIRAAAERNGVVFGSEDWYLLLAIRKSENGGPGNEFGIKCRKHINTNLDLQAACSAVTVRNSRARWERAGKPGAFVVSLAGRYCPEAADPVGYRNWLINVPHWQERLRYGRKAR